MSSQEEQIEALKQRHGALVARVRDVLSGVAGAASVRPRQASYPFGATNPLGGMPINVESLDVEWTDSNGDQRRISFEFSLSPNPEGNVYAGVKPICYVAGLRVDDPGVIRTDLMSTDPSWYFQLARSQSWSLLTDQDITALTSVKKPLPSPWQS